MRILLDTNVLARAAKPGDGPARALLLKCMEEEHILLVSTFILSELSRVLRYERVRNIHRLDDAGIDEFVFDVQSGSEVIQLPDTPADRIVPFDSDDDPILAAAFAGNAEVLCTLDRDLRHPAVRAHCEAQGLKILSDVELLKLLRATEETASDDNGSEGVSE